MQIHPPSSDIPDEGEFGVSMNAGYIRDPFAVVEMGNIAIFVESDEDADRVIRAMVRTKAMRAAITRPHPFIPGTRGRCEECGLIQRSHPGPPAAEAARTECGRTECVLPAGHDGPHDAAVAGEVCIVARHDDPSDLMPTESRGACLAKAVRSSSPVELYCWRKDGHEGPHYDSADKLHWTVPEGTRA